MSYGRAIGMSDRDFEALPHVRLSNPPEYMRWFKNFFPNEYADWYSRFYAMPRMANSTYQADRRGSGHSGQSSVNNDVISGNDEK